MAEPGGRPPTKAVMVMDSRRDEEGVSLLEFVNMLLAHRWLVVGFALCGALLAIVFTLMAGRTWTVRASFLPQGNNTEQAGLMQLAGRFGVPIPGGGSYPGESPQFYADLVTSRVVLGPIVDDTVMAARHELPGRGWLDALREESTDSAVIREETIEDLRDAIQASVTQTTGVVGFSVRTRSPEFSHHLAERIVEGVNRFNLQTRQSQAAAERRFAEERLGTGREGLREAEERLARFLEGNRQFRNSPELNLEFERLQREIMFQQEVLVGMAQSYESSRLKEIRDVPVITVIEPPAVPARPDRRGLVVWTVIGLVLGSIAGSAIGLVRGFMDRETGSEDREAARFRRLIAEARDDLTRWLPFGHSRSAGAARKGDAA